MSAGTVPPYIDAAKVAEACGLTTERARRMLQRAGVAEKMGGRWVVSRSHLRNRLPDVYEDVFAHFGGANVEDVFGPEDLVEDL